MKNFIREKAISTRNHVVKHRFKYGVATGLSAGLYLSYRSGKQINEFLEEKGIDTMEYWNPEYYAELHP